MRSRISAPARRAASTSSASSTVRRGQYMAAVPSTGSGRPCKAASPVDVHLLDGRAAGRRQRLQQAPLGEKRRSPGPHKMGRHGIAGKLGAIDGEHAPAFSCQQHRQRRAGAARANDDDVVAGHRWIMPAGGAPLQWRVFSSRTRGPPGPLTDHDANLEVRAPMTRHWSGAPPAKIRGRLKRPCPPACLRTNARPAS